MKILYIYTKKCYEQDGEKKIKWYRVGYMKETDKGTRYIRLFQQPDTEFFLFEKEKLPEIPF